MDLDIDNYSLQDLLHLFKLSHNYTEQELKEARKIVVSVHPDKSGLKKEYFLFYHRAYTMLNTIYKFKHKKESNMTEPTQYEVLPDTDRDQLAATFSKNPQFNKEFNKLFDTLYVAEEDGYGEWLKEDISPITNRSMIVSCIESANSISAYTDLKSAYTESIDTDSTTNRSITYDELVTQRAVVVEPLSDQQSRQQLANKKELEDEQATSRAFQLLQEESQSVRQTQSFWGSLLRLHN